MSPLLVRCSALFVLLLFQYCYCSKSYSQSDQKSLEKASIIILSDKLDNRIKSSSLGSLSEEFLCNDVNDIIRRNNKAIYNMSIGDYGDAKTLLNAALEDELVLKSHLDNSVLEYNLAIAKLCLEKSFCFTEIDSARLRLLIVPQKHEAFGLNYYLGMADFFQGNFNGAASYFQYDFAISKSERALFSEIYSLYLTGSYEKAYDIYSNNTSLIQQFVGDNYKYRYILGNVCSRAKHHREAISCYEYKSFKGRDEGGFNHFVAKSDSTLANYLAKKAPQDKLCYQKYLTADSKDLEKISVLFETMELGNIQKAKRGAERLKLDGSLKKTKLHLKAQVNYQYALLDYRKTGRVREFTTAKKSFLDLDKPNGSKLDVNVLLGIVMSAYYCGETEISEEKLEIATRLYPNDLKIKEASALIKFSKREDDAAISELNQIMSKSEEYQFSYDATMSAAFYYLNRNDLKAYEYWEEKLASNFPKRAGYFAIRAIEMEKLAKSSQRSDSAKHFANQSDMYFRQAIKLEPRQSTFYANYANLLFDQEFGSLSYIFNKKERKNRYKKTKNLYATAISLDSENLYAYNGKAMCFYYEWQRETAEKEGKANQSNVDSAIYYLDKAIAAAKRNSMDIHFYRQSLISLYLNKQWMLIGVAKSYKGSLLADSLMNQAWTAAELGMLLGDSEKYMFLINQGVGWSQISNESKMNELFDMAIELFPDNSEVQAIVNNNKGVFYLVNPPTWNTPSRRSTIESAEVSMNYFKKGLETSSSHTLVYYIDSNIKNYSRLDNLRNIYYYDPVRDYRPRNIELNIDFDRPYFNPQIKIVISEMETFPLSDISTEECKDSETRKKKKKAGKSRFRGKDVEKMDEGVHCPTEK